MRKLKIYLETTVFNYYFDEERDEHPATVKLFEEIKEGKIEALTSTVVVQELADTKNKERRERLLGLIEKFNISVLEAEKGEIKFLAQEYINEGIIPSRKFDDAWHIAVATFYEFDCIVSMNFSHINKYKTKVRAISVNRKYGYNKIFEICSSWEVVEYED